MSARELPSEVRCRELPDGVRYRVASANGVASGMIGWGCFLVLLVLPLSAAVEAGSFLATQRPEVGPLEGLAWVGLGSVYLLSAWWLGQMFLALVSSSVVELRQGVLWVGQRSGPWRSGQGLGVDEVARLAVHVEPVWRMGNDTDPEEQVEPEEPNRQLIAECLDKPALVLAVHAKPEVLTALGEDLRQRLLVSPEAVSPAAGLRQPVVLIDELRLGLHPRPDQPLYSRVACEERPDGVTLTFPATGFKGLGDLFWLVCLLAYAVGTPAALWLRWDGMEGRNIFVFSVLGLWWLLAVFLLKWSIESRFLPTVVRADAEQLQVQLPGLTSFARRTWPASGLNNVYGFSTGVQITDPNDETIDLALPVQDVVEAQWVATLLRRALGLPRLEEPSPPDLPDTDIPSSPG